MKLTPTLYPTSLNRAKPSQVPVEKLRPAQTE